MKLNFRRVILTGRFIPEIDGLRFIAIFSVVFYHLNGFLVTKDQNEYTTIFDFSFLNSILSKGHIGVPLFFIISGFILSRPFIQSYLKDKPKINIKNYFVRRLTRLEPPYIIVMTGLFIGMVFIVGKYSFSESLCSYLASIIYCHNFIYGNDVFPLLNAVAWSLEIEVQFYILMPLMALVFLIKKNILRRFIIIFVLVFSIFIDYYESLPFRSIINYLEYFLLGFLLADIYVLKQTIFPKTKVDSIITICLFVLLWHLTDITTGNIGQYILKEIVHLGAMILFCYYVLFHKSIPLLAEPFVTNLGGMCYSIYLLHYPLISIFGNEILQYKFFESAFFNVSFYVVIIMIIVLLISVLFFLFIERPCMDKDWPRKVWSSIRPVN